MRIKICGLTQPVQARAIAELGASSLGFICVAASPRYVTPAQIETMIAALPQENPPDRVGVFANPTLAQVEATLAIAPLSAIQLHGQESPQFCQLLRQRFPDLELIKAFRIRSAPELAQTEVYCSVVDTLLLDAYHPQQLGGTGKTLDWRSLQLFQPASPWLLAGGLNPKNILVALRQLSPAGIDLSSGVEHSPGDKDLTQVAQLFEQLQASDSPIRDQI
ncbi:MAG: phosphoribosylanthranilate isomerase [Leptolyngbyaceae cyanobacterium SM1_1_3]|nr:phosphoribosylanthranilate isomerase [Leptolyngbyaceae cyanobacterium SM1_1_3]NJN02282.1 phosphoribosylanthranilate isomerase [Leptolyngbyaceae cyanobacterium RM1_1_2]NJO08437.1 phosphoribosylanthranilate isomerase [Leptolyngbyaceae cyanobacterium SL_1_1]